VEEKKAKMVELDSDKSFMENFVFIIEGFIVEQENWRSIFLSIDSLRYFNKYHHSDLKNLLMKYTPHIIDSV